MRRSIRLAAWAAVLLMGWAVFPVLGSDLSKFLHAVIEDQYGRPPTGAEVNYYSIISRTEGPLESQIRMVAADTYFYGACKQNPDVYVTRMYEIFLGRDPGGDELRYWVSQLPRGTSDDRVVFISSRMSRCTSTIGSDCWIVSRPFQTWVTARRACAQGLPRTDPIPPATAACRFRSLG